MWIDEKKMGTRIEMTYYKREDGWNIARKNRLDFANDWDVCGREKDEKMELSMTTFVMYDDWTDVKVLTETTYETENTS